MVVFALFRLYNSIWSFVSVDELFRLILAHGVLLVLMLIVAGPGPPSPCPGPSISPAFARSFASTTCLRFSYRFLRQLKAELSPGRKKSGCENVMIIGAGEAGRSLIRANRRQSPAAPAGGLPHRR